MFNRAGGCMVVTEPKELLGLTYNQAWLAAGGAISVASENSLESLLMPPGEDFVVKDLGAARDIVALAGAHEPNFVLSDNDGNKVALPYYVDKPAKPGFFARLRERHPLAYKILTTLALVGTVGLAGVAPHTFGKTTDSSWTAQAHDTDYTWPEGMTASQIAETLGLDISLELNNKIISVPNMLNTSFENVYAAGEPVLTDNFIVMMPGLSIINETFGTEKWNATNDKVDSADVLPANVDIYDFSGKLVFSGKTAYIKSYDEEGRPVHPNPTVNTGDEAVVYCTPENKTALVKLQMPLIKKDILNECNAPLYNGKAVVFGMDDWRTLIFNSGGDLLANLSAEEFNRYVDVAEWRDELFVFDNSTKPHSIAAFDYKTGQLHKTPLPSGLEDALVNIFGSTHLDFDGNFIFLAESANNKVSKVLKYDGAQISETAFSVPFWQSPDGIYRNPIAAFDFNTGLFLLYNASMPDHYELWNLSAKEHILDFPDGIVHYFDGKNLFIDVLAGHYNKLLSYDVTKNRTNIMEYDSANSGRIDKNTFWVRNYTDEILFIHDGKAIRLTDRQYDILHHNGKYVAWRNDEMGSDKIFLAKLEDLVSLLDAPPQPRAASPVREGLLVPKIIYDSRPDEGSLLLNKTIFFNGEQSDTENVSFYHPAFPRKIDEKFAWRPPGCRADLLSKEELQFGDDFDVKNNHREFDRDYYISSSYFKYTDTKTNETEFGDEVWIEGAPIFSAGDCAPVFYNVIDYSGFEVQEFFIYRPYFAGIGPFEYGFQHDHEYQISLVWVDKNTGKPFHFAVKDTSLPFVDDVWQQKSVISKEELVAYAQWKSGGLGLEKNASAPAWRNGLGPVVSQHLGNEYGHVQPISGGVALYPLESIANDSDLDSGRYKAGWKHYPVFGKTGLPAKAPWLIDPLKDPEGLIRHSPQKQYYISYFEFGGPLFQKSFWLGGNVSRDTYADWGVPNSALEEDGFIISEKPAAPAISVRAFSTGAFDLNGHIIGVGKNKYANFSLSHIPIIYKQRIQVTPNWKEIANGTDKSLDIRVGEKYGNCAVTLKTKPTLTGEEFDQLVDAARASACPDKNIFGRLADLPLPYVAVLGAQFGMIGYMAWRLRQGKRRN